MRGYLSPVNKEAGKISLDSRVELYRDPGDTEQLIARTSDGKQRLGIRDVTVSRLKDGTPPVVIEPRQSCIEIHNKRNTNGVTVASKNTERELEKGRTATVEDTATVTLGYQAKFRLTVEREAKTEFNIQGSVTGDVVAGDQKNVDDRTQVVDSVVNRSDIGGEGGAEVDDSVVNRSDVGGEGEAEVDDGVNGSAAGGEEPMPSSTNTQKHCEKHQQVYTGDTCPKCRAEAGGSAGGTTQETKYCMFCGASIPEVARVCPECGERLPEQ